MSLRFRALLIIAGFGFACSTKALPLVVWSQDSTHGFDVTLSGDLSALGQTWGGSVNSPSGLWRLGTFNNLPSVTVGWFGTEYIADHTTFDGTFVPTGDYFFTFAAFSSTYQGIGSTFGGSAEIVFSDHVSWTGTASTFLTVVSNPNDYSGADPADFTDYTSWQYAIRLYARGPSLTPVPETAATAGLLVTGLLAVTWLRKRRDSGASAKRSSGS